MTGRSTRIIGESVQELFKNGEAFVTDHLDPDKYPQCSMNTFDRVLKRLAAEHPKVYKVLKTDRKKRRIYMPIGANEVMVHRDAK